MEKLHYLEMQKLRMKKAKDLGVLVDIEKENKKFDLMWKDLKTQTITKDNIHLYYEFMNEEIIHNIYIIDSLLRDRYFLILQHFKDISFIENKNAAENKKDFEQLHWDGWHIKINGYKYYRISYFGVKDTLKPIDEYIEEIKTSSEYKEYINPIISIDTELSLDDTMSFLNTNDHQEETICTIDCKEGISFDIQYIDTGKNTYLRMFIFLANGEGDYCPLEGKFNSIRECSDYIKNLTIQDMKDEL